MKKIGVPRNVLYTTLSWGVPLGLTFVATPIIVRGLGHEQYGLYSLVQGFIAYSFNFNVGRALTKYISTYQAHNETEKIGEALSATLLVNLVLGFACTITLAVLSGWLVPSILKIPLPMQQRAQLAFYLASVTLLPMMLSYVFNAVPQAMQRFDIYALVTLGGSAFNMVGNAVLVWFGYGILVVLAWNLLGAALVCAVFIYYARILLPGVHLVWRVPRELLWGVVKFTFFVAVYQMLGNLLLLFERSWITRKLGAGAITYYVIPMNIAIYIHAFIYSMTLVIFPLASEAKALRDVDRLRVLYTRALKYIGMFVVFLVLTLCVCGYAFLYAWMGPDIADHSARVLTYQAIVFGLMALCVIPWQMADGLGAPSLNALLVIAWLAIGIPLMVWLTPTMGITGTAVARLISMVAVPVHALAIERWALGKNLWGFWGRTVSTLVLAGAAAGVVEFLLLRVGPHGWTGLFVAILAGGLTYLGALFVTRFISRDEQTWLRSFVMRAVTP